MQNSLFLLDQQSKTLKALEQTSMAAEDFLEPKDLETWLASVKADTSIFGRKILWITRQDRIADDQRSDLIGVADNGDLVVAELKRGELDEPAIMQALSYAATYNAKTGEDLASAFFEHSTKHGQTTSLVNRVSSLEEAATQIRNLISKPSDDPVEINSAQTILLIAEDFSAPALKTCDYLNQAMTSGGQLIIECWRYRLYKEPTGKYFFSIERVLPRLELSDEIETSREKAKASKYLRDPIRRTFIAQLKGYLNSVEGFEATRNQGQSYEFEVRLEDWPQECSAAVYAHDEGPVRLIPGGSLKIPENLPNGIRKSKHWDDRDTLELVGTDAKTLTFTKEIGDLVASVLKQLTHGTAQDL